MKKFSIGLLSVFICLMSFTAAHALTDGMISWGDLEADLSGIGLAQETPSVHVNPAGLGDALIYGYYNVRSGEINAFNVVNTATSYGVRARIRFIEAKDSFEVLDFDICLSAGDEWNGIIMNNGGVGTLHSLDDDTYVDVVDPRGDTSFIFYDKYTGNGSGVGFKYGSENPNDVDADDTLEGYFLIIAENWIDEVSSGGNCGDHDDDLSLGSVGNVLMGTASQLDSATLANYSYNATALADFYSSVYTTDPTTAAPNLANGDDGIEGLNYVLTKASLYTTYDLLATADAVTALVVNFPTRSLTEVDGSDNDIFDDDRVLINIWDDEENSPETVCEFSPCPTGTDTELEYEVNVIDLNNSNLFDSEVETELTIPYEYGWIEIDMVNASVSVIDPAHQTTNPYAAASSGLLDLGSVSHGLPAIGYQMHILYDDTNPDFPYSALVPMQYMHNIE